MLNLDYFFGCGGFLRFGARDRGERTANKNTTVISKTCFRGMMHTSGIAVRIAATALFALAATAILPANNAQAQAPTGTGPGLAGSLYILTDNDDATLGQSSTASFNVDISGYTNNSAPRWLGANVIMTTTAGHDLTPVDANGGEVVDSNDVRRLETDDFFISIERADARIFLVTEGISGGGTFQVVIPGTVYIDPNAATVPVDIIAKAGAALGDVTFTAGDARRFRIPVAGDPPNEDADTVRARRSSPTSDVTYTIVPTSATLATVGSTSIPAVSGTERTFSVTLANIPSTVTATDDVQRVRLLLEFAGADLETGNFTVYNTGVGDECTNASCGWEAGEYRITFDAGATPADYSYVSTSNNGQGILDVPIGSLTDSGATILFTLTTRTEPDQDAIDNDVITVKLARFGLRADNDSGANLREIFNDTTNADRQQTVTYDVIAAPAMNNARLDGSLVTIDGVPIILAEAGATDSGGTVSIDGSTVADSRTADVVVSALAAGATVTAITATRDGNSVGVGGLSGSAGNPYTAELRDLFPGVYEVRILTRATDTTTTRRYDITLTVRGVSIARTGDAELAEAPLADATPGTFTISLAGIDRSNSVTGVNMVLEFTRTEDADGDSPAPVDLDDFALSSGTWQNNLFGLTFTNDVNTIAAPAGTADRISFTATFPADNAGTPVDESNTLELPVTIAAKSGNAALRGDYVVSIVSVNRVTTAGVSQGTVTPRPSAAEAFTVVGGTAPALELTAPDTVAREADTTDTGRFQIALANLADSTQPVRIPYTLNTGTATLSTTGTAGAGADYTVELSAGAHFGNSGSRTQPRTSDVDYIAVNASQINGGDATITMTVTAVDDRVREAAGRETVILVLSEPTDNDGTALGVGLEIASGLQITIADGGIGAADGSTHDFTDVCDRTGTATTGVQGAIITAIGGSPACDTIVASDIEDLGNGNANYGLAINDLGGTLALGDLDDLDEVKRLTIRDNALTGLPDNIFRDMGTLQRLRADANNFTGEFNRAVFSSLGGSDANPGFSSLTRIDFGSNGDFADNALDDVLLGLERVTINGDDLKRYANFNGATSMVVPGETAVIPIELRTATAGATDGDLPVAVMVPVTVTAAVGVTPAGTVSVTGSVEEGGSNVLTNPDSSAIAGVVIPAGTQRAFLRIAAAGDATGNRVLTIGEPVVGIIDTAAATFTASTHTDRVDGAITVADNIVQESFVQEGTAQATVALAVGLDTTLSALGLTLPVPTASPVTALNPTLAADPDGPFSATYPFGTTGITVSATANDGISAVITSITGTASGGSTALGNPLTGGTEQAGSTALTGLTPGANTVEILLSADDGTTTATATYTITVTVETDPTLSSLRFIPAPAESGPLTPGFDADTFAYTASFGATAAIGGISIIATAADTEADIVSITATGDTVIASDLESGGTDQTGFARLTGFATGNDYAITITVSPEIGEDVEYVITATILRSITSLLESLAVTNTTGGAAITLTQSGTTTTGFAAVTNDYTASVTNSVTSVTIALTADSAGTYAVTSSGAAPTNPSGPADTVVPLAADETTVSIVVTSEDGENERTYTIRFTRAPALASLALTGGGSTVRVDDTTDTINDATARSFGVTLPGAATATLTVSATDNTATIDNFAPVTANAITFGGTTTGTGTIAGVTLADIDDDDDFTFDITPVGGTAVEYTVTISHLNTRLSALTLTAPVPSENTAVTALNPTLADAPEGPFNATYPFGTTGITLTVAPDDGGADITTITATDADSNTLTPSVTSGVLTTDGATIVATVSGLTEGDNTVVITLTASDNSTATYTITVTVETNPTLSRLALPGLVAGNALPFNGGTTAAEFNAGNPTASFTNGASPQVDATATTGATVSIAVVDSDGNSPPTSDGTSDGLFCTCDARRALAGLIGFSTGDYAVTITLSPLLGADVEYRFTLIILPSTVASLSDLTAAVTTGDANIPLTPATFDTDTLAYTATVANSVTSVTIDPTATMAATAAAAGTYVVTAADADGNVIALTSGGTNAAAVVPLAVGVTTVSIAVTAEDTTTTGSNPYTIVFTRPAALKSLTLVGGTSSVGVNIRGTTDTSFDVTLPGDTTATLIVDATDPDATIDTFLRTTGSAITFDGVSPGTSSSTDDITVALADIADGRGFTFEIDPAGAAPAVQYTVTISHINMRLGTLTLTAPVPSENTAVTALNPTLADAPEGPFNATYPFGTTGITLTTAPDDGGADITTITATDAGSNTLTPSVTSGVLTTDGATIVATVSGLTEGDNTVEILLTASDDSEVTYMITVTVAPPKPTEVVSFLENTDPIAEAGGTSTLTLTLDVPIPTGDPALDFPYEITGIDAADITGNLTGTITVAAESDTGTLVITGASDVSDEGPETMTITLGALPSNADATPVPLRLVSGFVAPQITITDRDASFEFVNLRNQRMEIGGNPGEFTLRIREFVFPAGAGSADADVLAVGISLSSGDDHNGNLVNHLFAVGSEGGHRAAGRSPITENGAQEIIGADLSVRLTNPEGLRPYPAAPNPTNLAQRYQPYIVNQSSGTFRVVLPKSLFAAGAGTVDDARAEDITFQIVPDGGREPARPENFNLTKGGGDNVGVYDEFNNGLRGVLRDPPGGSQGAGGPVIPFAVVRASDAAQLPRMMNPAEQDVMIEETTLVTVALPPDIIAPADAAMAVIQMTPSSDSGTETVIVSQPSAEGSVVVDTDMTGAGGAFVTKAPVTIGSRERDDDILTITCADPNSNPANTLCTSTTINLNLVVSAGQRLSGDLAFSVQPRGGLSDGADVVYTATSISFLDSDDNAIADSTTTLSTAAGLTAKVNALDAARTNVLSALTVGGNDVYLSALSTGAGAGNVAMGFVAPTANVPVVITLDAIADSSTVSGLTVDTATGTDSPRTVMVSGFTPGMNTLTILVDDVDGSEPDRTYTISVFVAGELPAEDNSSLESASVDGEDVDAFGGNLRTASVTIDPAATTEIAVTPVNRNAAVRICDGNTTLVSIIGPARLDRVATIAAGVETQNHVFTVRVTAENGTAPIDCTDGALTAAIRTTTYRLTVTVERSSVATLQTLSVGDVDAVMTATGTGTATYDVTLPAGTATGALNIETTDEDADITAIASGNVTIGALTTDTPNAKTAPLTDLSSGDSVTFTVTAEDRSYTGGTPTAIAYTLNIVVQDALLENVRFGGSSGTQGTALTNLRDTVTGGNLRGTASGTLPAGTSSYLELELIDEGDIILSVAGTNERGRNLSGFDTAEQRTVTGDYAFTLGNLTVGTNELMVTVMPRNAVTGTTPNRVYTIKLYVPAASRSAGIELVGRSVLEAGTSAVAGPPAVLAVDGPPRTVGVFLQGFNTTGRPGGAVTSARMIINFGGGNFTRESSTVFRNNRFKVTFPPSIESGSDDIEMNYDGEAGHIRFRTNYLDGGPDSGFTGSGSIYIPIRIAPVRDNGESPSMPYTAETAETIAFVGTDAGAGVEAFEGDDLDSSEGVNLAAIDPASFTYTVLTAARSAATISPETVSIDEGASQDLTVTVSAGIGTTASTGVATVDFTVSGGTAAGRTVSVAAVGSDVTVVPVGVSATGGSFTLVDSTDNSGNGEATITITPPANSGSETVTVTLTGLSYGGTNPAPITSNAGFAGADTTASTISVVARTASTLATLQVDVDGTATDVDGFADDTLAYNIYVASGDATTALTLTTDAGATLLVCNSDGNPITLASGKYPVGDITGGPVEVNVHVTSASRVAGTGGAHTLCANAVADTLTTTTYTLTIAPGPNAGTTTLGSINPPDVVDAVGTATIPLVLSGFPEQVRVGTSLVNLEAVNVSFSTANIGPTPSSVDSGNLVITYPGFYTITPSADTGAVTATVMPNFFFNLLVPVTNGGATVSLNIDALNVADGLLPASITFQPRPAGYSYEPVNGTPGDSPLSTSFTNPDTNNIAFTILPANASVAVLSRVGGRNVSESLGSTGAGKDYTVTLSNIPSVANTTDIALELPFEIVTTDATYGTDTDTPPDGIPDTGDFILTVTSVSTSTIFLPEVTTVTGDGTVGTPYTGTIRFTGAALMGVVGGTGGTGVFGGDITLTIVPRADGLIGANMDPNETVILNLDGDGTPATVPADLGINNFGDLTTRIVEEARSTATISPATLSLEEAGADGTVTVNLNAGVGAKESSGRAVLTFTLGSDAAFGTDYTLTAACATGNTAGCSGTPVINATTLSVAAPTGGTAEGDIDITINPTADSTAESNEDIVFTLTNLAYPDDEQSNAGNESGVTTDFVQPAISTVTIVERTASNLTALRGGAAGSEVAITNFASASTADLDVYLPAGVTSAVFVATPVTDASVLFCEVTTARGQTSTGATRTSDAITIDATTAKIVNIHVTAASRSSFNSTAHTCATADGDTRNTTTYTYSVLAAPATGTTTLGSTSPPDVADGGGMAGMTTVPLVLSGFPAQVRVGTSLEDLDSVQFKVSVADSNSNTHVLTLQPGGRIIRDTFGGGGFDMELPAGVTAEIIPFAGTMRIFTLTVPVALQADGTRRADLTLDITTPSGSTNTADTGIQFAPQTTDYVYVPARGTPGDSPPNMFTNPHATNVAFTIRDAADASATLRRNDVSDPNIPESATSGGKDYTVTLANIPQVAAGNTGLTIPFEIVTTDATYGATGNVAGTGGDFVLTVSAGTNNSIDISGLSSPSRVTAHAAIASSGDGTAADPYEGAITLNGADIFQILGAATGTPLVHSGTLTLTIVPTNDGLDGANEDPNETVILRLDGDGTPATVPGDLGINNFGDLTTRIVERATVSITPPTATAAEGGADAALTVTISRGPILATVPATVTFTVAGGGTGTTTAGAGDYAITSTNTSLSVNAGETGGTFTIAANDTTAPLTIEATDDSAIDPGENITITITSVQFSGVGEDDEHLAAITGISSIVTLGNDDAGATLQNFSTNNIGESGAITSATFDVVISSAPDPGVVTTINLTMTGSATYTDDYTIRTGSVSGTDVGTATGSGGTVSTTVTPGAGAATVTFYVVAVNDTTPSEGNQTVIISLEDVTDTASTPFREVNPSAAARTVTIDDDDEAVSGFCNRTAGVVTAILADAAITGKACPVTSTGEVTEAELAAVTSLDLQNLSIAAGDLADLDGLMTLNITGATLANGALAPVLDTLMTLTASAAIRSVVSVASSATAGTIPRGESRSFTITRTNPHTAITVPYTLTYTNATVSDFTVPSTDSVTFAAGVATQTVAIRAMNNAPLIGQVVITLNTPTLPGDTRGTPIPALVTALTDVPAATDDRTLDVVLPSVSVTLSPSAISIGEKSRSDGVVTLSFSPAPSTDYGIAQVSFSLSAPAGGVLPVLATSALAADPPTPADADYNLVVNGTLVTTDGMLNLSAGTASATFTFTPIDDDRTEGSEVVTLTVTGVDFASADATDFTGSLTSDVTITELAPMDVMREVEMIAQVAGKEQVNLVTGLIRQRVGALSLAPTPTPTIPGSSGDSGVQLSLAENPETMQDFFSQMALESSGDMDDGGSYSLWAKGQYISVSGSPDVTGLTNFEYDGTIFGGGVGIERRRKETLFGMSLNHTVADIDSESTTRGKSTYEEDLMLFVPYAAWSPGNSRMTLWGAAGFGTGTAKITSARHTPGSPSVQVLFAQGGVDISDKLGETVDIVLGMSAVAVEKTVDAFTVSIGTIPEAESSLFQGQADFTAYFPVYSKDGQVLRPYLGIASVHDAGDVQGDDRHAMELQTGIAWSSGPTQISADTFYQFLREDEEAWGIFGEVSYAATVGPGGLFMGMTGGHGTASSMSEAAASTDSINNDIDTTLADADSDVAEWRFETSTEYGFAAPIVDRNGRATPFFRTTHSADARSFASGVRVDVTDEVGLTLESSRHIPSDDDPYSEHAVGLEARWEF